MWSDASLAFGRAGLGFWLEVSSVPGVWSPAFFCWSFVQAGWQANILEFESLALLRGLEFFRKWLRSECIGKSEGGLSEFGSVLKGMQDRRDDKA